MWRSAKRGTELHHEQRKGKQVPHPTNLMIGLLDFLFLSLCIIIVFFFSDWCSLRSYEIRCSSLAGRIRFPRVYVLSCGDANFCLTSLKPFLLHFGSDDRSTKSRQISRLLYIHWSQPTGLIESLSSHPSNFQGSIISREKLSTSLTSGGLSMSLDLR